MTGGGGCQVCVQASPPASSSLSSVLPPQPACIAHHPRGQQCTPVQAFNQPAACVRDDPRLLDPAWVQRFGPCSSCRLPPHAVPAAAGRGSGPAPASGTGTQPLASGPRALSHKPPSKRRGGSSRTPLALNNNRQPPAQQLSTCWRGRRLLVPGNNGCATGALPSSRSNSCPSAAHRCATPRPGPRLACLEATVRAHYYGGRGNPTGGW